jgi:hypothetical protein
MAERDGLPDRDALTDVQLAIVECDPDESNPHYPPSFLKY